MTATASSSRAWRVGTGSKARPIASYSGLFQPAPRATSSRPSDRTSSVARSWARTAGWRRSLLWTNAAIRSVVVAAATTTLRIAAFVHNNDLRHPAVLAQDLATLDVLSGGRLDVALGAGWNKPEYDAIGLMFDPVPTRQARLEEAVAVIKGAFSGEPFSFHGEHYEINDYQGSPKPTQQPHPPIFIGGGGRRTLTLAGRE